MILLLLFWAVCSAYTWGTTMAFFTVGGGYPRDTVGVCALLALMGPLGALIAVFASNFNQYGWHLWQSSK